MTKFQTRNPKYESISKLDDVAKYNSSVNQVAFYKNYPNRSGTPIKIRKSPEQPKVETSGNDKNRHLQKILQSTFTDDMPIDPQLLKNALKAELRIGSTGPGINTHGNATNASVMNDFHNKQTNPGFARNNLGGFYTR